METSRISVFYRGLIVLAGVVLIQLLMLGFQLRTQADIPLVRFGTVMIIEPVQRAINATADGARSVWTGYLDLRNARQESRALGEKLDQLKLENQQLATATAEVTRLRGLLDLKALVPGETVAARVLGGSASESSRLLMIDKGSKAGIRPDAPVMVPDGVVGKVLAVFPDSAQVILLSDPFSGAGVLLENNRMHGVLKGRNQELLRLDFIPNGEPIATGQRVFTSGEDRIYPPGLAVGIVENTAPGAKFQEIAVRPLAALQSLEEVLVILNKEFVLPLPEPKAPQLEPAASAPAAGSSAKPTTATATPTPAPTVSGPAPASTISPPPPPTANLNPAPRSSPAAAAAAPQTVVDNSPAPASPAPSATSIPTGNPSAPE